MLNNFENSAMITLIDYEITLKTQKFQENTYIKFNIIFLLLHAF